MPKLTAKRKHSPYLTFQQNVNDKALAQTELLLRVVYQAGQALIEMMYQDERSPLVDEAIINNFRTLSDLHRKMTDRTNQLGDVLNIVESKLAQEQEDLLGEE